MSCIAHASGRVCRLALRVLLALLLFVATVARADQPALPVMPLSGLLLYAADAQGERVGPIWHTARGGRAGPLAFNAFNPGSARTMSFTNDSRGEIDQPLAMMTHVLTLYFQPEETFPTHLVLNAYFHGDQRDPKISLLVPHRRGFSHAYLNPAYQTYSLYLEEVDNSADLIYSDGLLQVRTGAAFFFPSSAVETRAWLPGDLFLIDRVGTRELEPDGEWDGILVVELDVAPAPRQAPTPRSLPKAVDAPAFRPPILVERSPPPPSATPPELEFPTPRTTSTAPKSETPAPARTPSAPPAATPSPPAPSVSATP
jgi:hypothetical protein